MNNLAVFELPQVKVSKEVIKILRRYVRDGFYRHSKEIQQNEIRCIAKELSTLYGVPIPPIQFGGMLSNSYSIMTGEIRLTNTSLISFLHEYRHHLQRKLGVRYRDLTLEQDARAWSMRVFSKAFPNMFEKAVKQRRVHHVKWDNTLNKVVDDCTYI